MVALAACSSEEVTGGPPVTRGDGGPEAQILVDARDETARIDGQTGGPEGSPREVESESGAVDMGTPSDSAIDRSPARDSGDAAPGERADAARPTDTLAGAAIASGHHMGAAVKAELLDSPVEPQYTTVLATHFDALVSEYQMKWDSTEPTEGQFAFGPGDAIIAFASRHGMIVKGHALVWHQQLPAWVSTLAAAELGPALDRHIATVAGHWKGQVYAWDVVNEAVTDDGLDYRNTIFYEKLGAAYIARAFRAARAADPGALLFYNDYGSEDLGAKANRVYTVLRDLKTAGVPVDGVGLQCHFDAATPPLMANVAANMDRLIALGLVVNLSEIDIRLGALPGTALQKLTAQRTLYHDLIQLCAARPKCHSATTWGFTDKYTWIDTFLGPNHAPLPFDANYAAKPAVSGIIDGWLQR
jgi:endo-1,4-beta-xylanase